MTTNPLDTSTLPLVAFLAESPTVLYGPMDDLSAMAFIEKWNTFFAERGLPGTWVVAPLSPAV